MSIEYDENLHAFREESLEHLADIENDLLAFEGAGAAMDKDLVNKVFRAAHSIKGGAGFMGLTVIQDLAHAAENVLGLIRSEKLVPAPDIINVLLLAFDELQQLIENVNDCNTIQIQEYLTALNAIYEANEVPPVTAESAPEPAVKSEVATEGAVDDSEPMEETEVIIESGPAPLSSLVASDSSPPEEKESIGKQPTDSSIRVAVSLLDELMNLAGELVLSMNQLLQTINSSHTSNAEAVGQRIDLVTSELQEAIMLTRMQPIGNVFNKFPRVVRDLSARLGRQIELTMVGEDVDLDKTILESISDPLTHLVRNSVEHGIETPDERTGKGKSPKGCIILRAFHEAGQVVIEISDDGKGIDGNMLVEVAMNKGLITADQAVAMSEKERINLILMPGFSTASEVTDVSGRGVGMDVVKTNLDTLGGSIAIDSEVDKGSTISIKLPLTLAIIPCQIVKTGRERYAIPQANLEELLRIPAAQVKNRVERVGDAAVVRLRGNLLPLIKLSDVLDIKATYEDVYSGEILQDRRKNIADRRSKQSPLLTSDEQEHISEEPLANDQQHRGGGERRHSPASTLNIVVVSAGTMKYGLIVDQLHDSEEIVIKPLGCHLQHCKGYAGATIMGDGQISLILDVSNLAKMAGLTSFDNTDRATEVAAAETDAIRQRKNEQALLTFKSSVEENFAIPLDQVERIEKIKRSHVEVMGGKRVMQYRGGSLPLLTIDDVAMVQPLVDLDDLLVFVFDLSGHSVGLLASGPVDALETTVEIDELTLNQAGIMGSTIINGQTTMMVDILDLVHAVFPEWFAEMEVAKFAEQNQTEVVSLSY